jgi:hypothetical protein
MENPYLPPQTDGRLTPTNRTSLLRFLVPTLLALLAYALYGILWLTPTPL